MSEISESIQAKCLTFGDRVIKLNDYLLKEVSQKAAHQFFKLLAVVPHLHRTHQRKVIYIHLKVK
jgi:hypothetical protein